MSSNFRAIRSLLWDGLLLSLQSVLSSPVLHLTTRASAFICAIFLLRLAGVMVIIRSQNEFSYHLLGGLSF
jgi:hypothetical protein